MAVGHTLHCAGLRCALTHSEVVYEHVFNFMQKFNHDIHKNA